MQKQVFAWTFVNTLGMMYSTDKSQLLLLDEKESNYVTIMTQNTHEHEEPN